ncbi:MAG TPA: hypothetical protein PL130_07780 [Dictyoglomaceae bacterium]|nr:hypothetical protein [Dictyoglomaceae bacterium]
MTQRRNHKIIVVTPAGRRRYLEIMSKYILKDNSIDEWHLWDNCRESKDREYINNLAENYEKIKIIREKNVDGSNKSVNKFYKYTRNDDTFYIKMDDDIVYLPENFGLLLYSKALKEKEMYSWWSPIVINNAICTYLLYAKNIINTNANITAQASCPIAWGSPLFAKMLHNLFLKSYNSSYLEKWKVKDSFELFLQRFSINTIGFFGDFSKKLGDNFCPLDVDDEEYISARLPILANKPGRLVGDILVAHFSFFTQEAFLLEKTNILQDYARIAGIHDYKFSYKKRKNTLKYHIKHLILYNGKYFLNQILNVHPSKKGEKLELKLNGG